MRSRRIDGNYAHSNKEEQVIPSLIRGNHIRAKKQDSEDNTVSEEDVEVRRINEEVLPSLSYSTVSNKRNRLPEELHIIPVESLSSEIESSGEKCVQFLHPIDRLIIVIRKEEAEEE